MNALKDRIQFELDYIDFEIKELEERIKKNAVELKRYVANCDTSDLVYLNTLREFDELKTDYNSKFKLFDYRRKLVNILDKAGCL